MRELAEKVIALTGSRSKIAYQPLPADDPRQRRPDISLAHKELGWQPGTPLDDGLTRHHPVFPEIAGLSGRTGAGASPPVGAPVAARPRR